MENKKYYFRGLCAKIGMHDFTENDLFILVRFRQWHVYLWLGSLCR